MDKTIHWGIIGAGNISSKFAEAIGSIKNAKLIGVAARDLQRAEQFADRFHIERAYGSYEELAQDPDIDAIYIGTLHTEHKDNAALCIRNHKSVLCEKPFTINQREAEELINLAKEYNVFLMEAMWTKFLPVIKMAKQWVKEKKIGEVTHIKASFGFQGGFDINSRLFNPDNAGGALLDVGVYVISFATYMLGRMPDHIFSTAVLGKSNVDEQNVLLLQYNDGIIADVSSAIRANLGDDACIIGEKGKIVIPTFWSAQKALLYDQHGNLMETYSEPFIKNGFEYEIMEVNSCIGQNQKESNLLPLQDTLSIMKIMDKARAQWGLTYPKERCQD
ncbi:MAG: oxidoreductase domain protein [Herbinix sp.]|nr:oxidoreductase domain protein [Herbinix sp.]